MPRQLLLRLLPWTVGVWLVGLLTLEVVATIGAWTTAVLGFLLSLPPSVSWRRWEWLYGFLVIALVMPMAGSFFPTGTGFARLADFLFIPAAAVATLHLSATALHRIALACAVVLFVSIVVAGLQHFGAWPPKEFFEPWRWTNLGFHRVYEPVPGRTDRFMAGGLLLHRLKFANVTAAFSALFACAAVLRVERWRFYAAVAAIGVVAVAVFPHARAASVSVVATVCVVWVLGASDRRRAIAGAAALVGLSLLVVLAVPSVRTRFGQAFTIQGTSERWHITMAGIRAIARHPLTGVGLDRFRPGLFTSADAPKEAKEHPGKAHNQFITLAAEAGLLSLALWLAVLVGWCREGLKALPRGALLVGAVTLFTLLSLLHDPLFHVESSMALMIVLGAGLGVARRPQGAPPAAL